MKTYNALKQFIVGFITGLFGMIDDDDHDGLKAERVQFWKDLIDPGWKDEGGGRALLRTIPCSNTGSADDLAKTLAGELARYGYRADALDVTGTVVSLRLATASVGKLTQRDYAAAALIDLVM